MTPQESVCFDVEYHGDLCHVQIGDVEPRKDVGRVGRNDASILIAPPQMKCIYLCKCNDSRGDHDRDNFGEGKNHISILRIGKEVKKDLMRNNYAMRSAEFGKVDNRRCKKVISEKGFQSIDEDSRERVRFCEVCHHACTIAEYSAPGRSKDSEEYLQGERRTQKGMKVPIHECNSLIHQHRKGSSSNCPGGNAILKYPKKGKMKKKKKKKRKEKSNGNITIRVAETSKMASLLYKRNLHRRNDKNLSNDNVVIPSSGEEKNENVIELSKGKPVNGLEGEIRISSYGKENALKKKSMLSCKKGRKVFRSHLKLHRLKCRSMKIIEKLKDAMIKENIAYNKRRMTRNGGHDGGSSLSIRGEEVGPVDKGDTDEGALDNDKGKPDNHKGYLNNDKGHLDNYPSHANRDRVGRGLFAKRTKKGTFLDEADCLVYKFRRTLRRYVKKDLDKKIMILENLLQAKRNIANEKMVHTFIVPSMSDRAHRNISNYCSYVDKYVRKFFDSYFVTLVNQFFNNYFFHHKRKCVKNYAGSFGARGGNLDGETASHHEPFCHSRYSTKNDNVACNKVICSSCLDISKANSAPSSGKEDTSREVKNMAQGRNSFPIFSLPNVNRNPIEGHGSAGRDPSSSYLNKCCNGESSVVEPPKGSNPSGSVLNRLHVEPFQKDRNFRVSANSKRRNSPCGEVKPRAADYPRERGSMGGERTQGRVCGCNDTSADSGGSGSGNGTGNSGGNGSGNGSGCSNGNSSGNSRGSRSKENGGSKENDGNSEDNNEDHNEDNNDDSGNDSSNESSNDSGKDNAKEKDTKGNNRGRDEHPDEPKEKSGLSTHNNEHENYYKLIREIESLENNENAKESTSVNKKDSIDTVPGGDEQKERSAGDDNCQIKLDTGTMEKEEDASMKLERSGEDNQLLNINQMIIHTSSYVSQPLKLPLLPEMSHPNSYSSLSPRNNTCGSSSSSSSSGSSGNGGIGSGGSGNGGSGSGGSGSGGSGKSSGSCNNQGGGKNNTNQLNDPDFEEACDIRLMNTPENMKFSQSPPTSSLHASSLHLTDVNELVLSPNQQIYSNSPLKSPNSTPLTPASPIFDSNYNEENMEKVNSNYLVSSPYRNDIFSEFDMLGSFFESLDELENKSDYTESSSNENSKFSHDFSLDMCDSKKGKKENIRKDEVIYNFKRDNYKRVFHGWCNKGKHELNYDNKKFNSIMEWINYIEELMSHEGQNDNKGDEEEQPQSHQDQHMGGVLGAEIGEQMGGQLREPLQEEQCDLHEMEHELEHEPQQEDIIKIGMNPNFFNNEENVYQVGNSAFRSDEYMPMGEENEGGIGEVNYGGSGEVDYSVNSGVDYLVSRGVDYMVSSMADYAVSGGGADCANGQGEYYKDSGDSGALKEENKCDNLLASQNVNVMMSTPEQCNNSFLADNLNAYQPNQSGSGEGGMSSPHNHCDLLSSSLIKPSYDANPCISNFGGEQNLLSEYNNAEDNITYCNNDTRQEAPGDYFLPSTLNGAQIESGSFGVGSSGFVWNNGASGAEGNAAGNIAGDVANVGDAADNRAGNHHAHVHHPLGTESTLLGLDDAQNVGTKNEKDTTDNSTPSSNCAHVPDPWLAQ
ncbi:hypothetical protein C922_01935 [Plasmodium inui San Antonio 1]|uniref:Uncharacterized protein n=1 Tax=Plasmodium inui San Antonio 1 TaxID=1237626 RepID=W7AQP1_9APIC|nr:hypothetical protein C922_01935 [Plasmodium inui San Antonio 1]EUD67746.1 hypothetical protein C922_01935 [Plasmodium inui San Antonio 1]